MENPQKYNVASIQKQKQMLEIVSDITVISNLQQHLIHFMEQHSTTAHLTSTCIILCHPHHKQNHQNEDERCIFQTRKNKCQADFDITTSRLKVLFYNCLFVVCTNMNFLFVIN